MQQRPRLTEPRLPASQSVDARPVGPLLERSRRARDVTAVLGPTNTGKTHLAIDRMLARNTGVIGLPLRLLAREVYGRIVARMGPEVVALITGEEKIIPPGARYYVATVEAMPIDLNVEFAAIDEVQLAADLERGRVFTDRILRVRGLYETLLLGALTARPLLEKLMPGINVVTRPRMSVLSYTGEKKITRLPPRSAVVTFSANEVYAIAELIRRQRGGAAIVMGALSPRTRNAQVELFQSGDVDFLIATDAIGMGLNLDVDHVAFASNRKFDGYQYRALNAAELGQIAGRAGRHMRDGTFGVTGRVGPLPDELVQQLETHAFQPAKVFQWRNAELDFASIPALRTSLDMPADEPGLSKAPPADDQRALEHAAKTPEIVDIASTREAVQLLWDVCQVPDYRKIAPANHADLLLTLYSFLMDSGAIPDDWIARQVRYADKVDGDIDTLSNRIAHVRTWTFVANRNDWLADPAEWRETTRQVEDRLSDALHERLMQRFVDRRTSVLMKRLRENAMLESEVNETGDVMVEGQHVGVLHGFRFQADPSAGDPRDAKALRAAAGKALQSELEKRADKVAAAPDAAFALGSDTAVRWQGAIIAKLSAGEDVLKPAVLLLADETLAAPSREKVQGRLNQWIAAHTEGLLKPLFDLRGADGMESGARGLAYRIAEGLGSVDRTQVANEAKALEQAARAGLRALGVRFGAYHIFVPALLKPAPSQLIALLWALKHADIDVPGLAEVPQLSASGRTSIAVDPSVPQELYRVVGFRVCGPRAVRIDILERLADQIRPLVAWRPSPEAGEPPAGAVPRGGGFLVTVTMTSLLGCSGDDFAAVLASLGYRVDRHEADEAEREALARAQAARRTNKAKETPAPATTPAPAAPAPAEPAPDAAQDASASPTAASPPPGSETVPVAPTAEATPESAEISPPVEASPPESAEASPPVEQPAPESAEASPPVEQPAPESAEASPPVEQPAPESAEALPPVEQPAPESAEASPPVEQPAPESAEAPPGEASAPESAEASPPVEQPAPESVVAPPTEASAPESAEASPPVEQLAPESAEALPPVEQPAPESAEASPPVEQPAPESAEALPPVEQPAPESAVAPAVEPSAPTDSVPDTAAAAPTEMSEAGANSEAPAESGGEVAAEAVEAAPDPQETAAAAAAESEPSVQEGADEAEGPVLIEIWRVPRHQRSEAPRRRRSRGSEGAGQGQERGDQRSRRGPKSGGGRGAPGGAPATPEPAHTGSAALAPAAAAPAAGAPAAAEPSPADARSDGKGGGKKVRRKGKGKGGNRHDGPPQGQRPAGRSGPRPEKVADPDSPFAALAALKKRLEQGDGR